MGQRGQSFSVCSLVSSLTILAVQPFRWLFISAPAQHYISDYQGCPAPLPHVHTALSPTHIWHKKEHYPHLLHHYRRVAINGTNTCQHVFFFFIVYVFWKICPYGPQYYNTLQKLEYNHINVTGDTSSHCRSRFPAI